MKSNEKCYEFKASRSQNEKIIKVRIGSMPGK